ncbi:MAG: uroporphyrinogen-III synthase [Alphaproteobacteria bacterium]|nr:uroporphyrinogen-III synthase [Alphaproteobacteria bacterium]
MRFIVTRPSEDAAKLITKLERDGHSGLAAPMIRIANLPDVTLPKMEWQAILVTSANSIRALAVLAGGSDLTAVPVLAVGPASAHAATSAGFKSVSTAQGDLEALSELAVRQLDPAKGPIFYPSGTIISGDLKAHLERQGFSCTRLPLYEAVPASEFSVEVASDIQDGQADGVLLFSPRSARIWSKCLANADLTEAASSLTHYCLSTAVADALKADSKNGSTFKSVAVAPEPNEHSLLQFIGAK